MHIVGNLLIIRSIMLPYFTLTLQNMKYALLRYEICIYLCYESYVNLIKVRMIQSVSTLISNGIKFHRHGLFVEIFPEIGCKNKKNIYVVYLIFRKYVQKSCKMQFALWICFIVVICIFCDSAGVLAKKAVEAGLSVKPYIKTSLSPGSGVVTYYLRDSGVTPYLEKLGQVVTVMKKTLDLIIKTRMRYRQRSMCS